MLRLAAIALVGVGLLAATSGACTAVPEVFHCSEHAQCTAPGDEQGHCEREGVCSAFDDECPTGRRYLAEHAGELSGTCVEPWIVQLSYAFTQHYPSLVLGADERLYLSDTFTDKVTIDEEERGSAGPTDIYVASFDRVTGALLEFEQLGGEGEDWLGGSSRYGDAIITSGAYDGGIQIDGVELSEDGAFVARRYDREWVSECTVEENAEGPAADVGISNVNVDGEGYVLAIGYYYGSNLYIDGQAVMAQGLDEQGDGFAVSFLAVFDGVGEFLGAFGLQKEADAITDRPTGGCFSTVSDTNANFAVLCLDPEGSVEIIAGSFGSDEPLQIAMASSATPFGAVSLSAIAFHPNDDGSLLATGIFYGIGEFPPSFESIDEPVRVEADEGDLFIVRLYPDELGTWRTIGLATFGEADAQLYPVAMATTPTSILLAGTIDGSIDGIGASNGVQDAFALRLDAEELTLISSLVFGGEGKDLLRSIAVDPGGNVYGFGQFTGTMTFGRRQLESLGPFDAFVAQLDL